MSGKPNFSMILPIEIRALAARYQRASENKSLSTAMGELIVLGYARWLESVPAGIEPQSIWGATPDEDAALLNEWAALEERPEFPLWVARKFAARWGGKR